MPAPSSPDHPAADTALPGSVASSPKGSDHLPEIPGYHLLGILGRGGMSVVYKAQQLQPARIVALKMILRGNHASAEQRLRFLHEAEAVAALHHPNIVDVYAVGQHEGVPYFTLEYVPGGSLADRVRDEPLSPRVAAEVMEPVARAIAAAHRAGFIHRDLKPDNILLAGLLSEERGSSQETKSLDSHTSPLAPKVTDFGIAKRLALESGLTQTGAVIGTPSYMAPEQAEHTKDVGPAADIWGLGATLYRILTGRPPFLGVTALDTLYQVMARDAVPPGELVPNIPRDLETICLKCLEKNPTRRYASADDLADDLRRFLSGQTIKARPVGPVERGVKWVRRNPVVAALLALVFVTLVSGTAVSTFFAFAAAREKAAARLSALSEARKADEANQAQERTRDVLCRSLFEQAKGLRQSRSPGRSWRTLELLTEAAALRTRPRGDLPVSDDLPSLTDLRSEAVSAAVLTDVRAVSEWAATGTVYPSGDGRVVALNVTRSDNPEKAQRRLLDLATGAELGRVDLTDDTAGAWALDRLGTKAAVIAPAQPVASLRRGVIVLELPSGKELFNLPWPKDPDRGLVVTPWDMQIAVHGDRLAAAKLDEECDWLILWDLNRPREPIRTFRFKHEPGAGRSRSQPLLFSADGRSVAISLYDRRMVVVRADGTGEPIHVTLPNAERMSLHDWIPERSWWLLVDQPVGGPATPLVWDYSTGREVFRLPACEPDALVTVADATRIAVGTTAGTVRLYEAATGRELGETPALHTRGLTRFQPLPDSRIWTSSDEGTLRIWEPISWPVGVRTLALTPGTEQVVFCPDRDLMVALRPTQPESQQTWYSRQLALSVHDSRNGRELRSWTEEVGPYPPIPLTGGRLVTLGSKDVFQLDPETQKQQGQTVTLRNLATGEVVSERRTGKMGFTIFLTSDGFSERDGKVFYAGQYPGTRNSEGVAVWDILAGKEVARLNGPDLATTQRAISVTADGKLLLSSPLGRDPEGKCVVWDVASKQPVGEIPLIGPHFIQWFTASPDGRSAVTHVLLDGAKARSEYHVYELPSGKLRYRITGRGMSETKAFSSDSRLMAISDVAAGIRVYDLATGEERFRWHQSDVGPIRNIHFTSSRGLAVLPRSGTPVRILDVEAVRRQLGPLGLGW